MSDRKEVGLDLHCGSIPIFVTADSGVIALTRQADVTVIAGGSGATSLVELTTNWERKFSKVRQSRSQFAVTNGRSRAVFWIKIGGFAVGTKPSLLFFIA